MTSGCQKFCGRPRSTTSTMTTSMYPMYAVNIAGRTIGSKRSAFKIWTVAAIVNPAAARPTPIKSKPIQKPHGN